jgi:hypothetical protein
MSIHSQHYNVQNFNENISNVKTNETEATPEITAINKIQQKDERALIKKGFWTLSTVC